MDTQGELTYGQIVRRRMIWMLEIQHYGEVSWLCESMGKMLHRSGILEEQERGSPSGLIQGTLGGLGRQRQVNHNESSYLLGVKNH